MPLGCGEQNMIYLAPNVYVLEYLTNTKQVTSDVEARAYRFIQQGKVVMFVLTLVCYVIGN